MNEAPIVGTYVCFREDLPPLKVVSVVKNKKTGADGIKLREVSGKDLVVFDFWRISYYPESGDRVVVAAGVYEGWMNDRMDELKKLELVAMNGQQFKFRKQYKEVKAQMDSFPIGDVFEFRGMQKDKAVIVAAGSRYLMPIGCLRVIEKTSVRQEQVA